MPPETSASRPHARRASVASEEDRTWIAFYRRVGRDPATAAEIMAQLDADSEMKRDHLALYLCCRQSVRIHRERQARDKRIGRFVRHVLHCIGTRPLVALRFALHRGAELMTACLPTGTREPPSRPAGRSSGFPATPPRTPPSTAPRPAPEAPAAAVHVSQR